MKQRKTETHEQYVQRILTRQKTRKKVRNFKTEMLKGIVFGCFMVGIIGLSFHVSTKVNAKEEVPTTETKTVTETPTETEIMIPISDFTEVYMGEDGYPHFVLKDYGNIADNPNNISYDEVISKINNGNEIKSHTEIQKYIIRYGVTYDYGATIITEDGNTWTLEDAPDYQDGTEVRVLFDSNGTNDATDDIIIDMTQR